MTEQIANGIRALGSSVSNMTQNKKIADLQRDTKDAHSKQNTTTDYGIKVSDLDHWLKTVDDKSVGPSTLEDQIARERVGRRPSTTNTSILT